MSRYILFIVLALCTTVYGQTSEKYNSEYAEFYRGEELFQKEQYGAARKTFRVFLDDFDKKNDPFYVKASYYEAISALELYNNDAITLLEAFNKNYPESIYKMDIYFRLGKFHFYKKKYEDAIVWFNKLSSSDLEEEDLEEFYFKLGYSYFKEEQLNNARDAFYEAKDGTTQYAKPSLYYYSHIAYQYRQYETALEGFLKLEEDEKFGKVVIYYIAQIYYLEGQYEKVTEYASRLSNNNNVVNEQDLNHLIGDAYYRIGEYNKAVPYLEDYNRAAQTTRDEDYTLGYAYYKSGRCEKSIRLFDRVTKVPDSLGQVAYYHIAECMLQANEKESARSAFEKAAFIDANDIIQEDALFNYAILSYQLDINPYGEAVEAFEMYLNKYPNSDRRDDVYQYLVNVYTSTNNYAKALTSLDKIPNKDVKLKTAYQLVAFNQGVDRYQKNNFVGAIKSFDLVKRYPVDTQISGKAAYWTADSKYRMSKFDEAIQGYQAFMGMPATMSPRLKQEAEYNIGYCYVKKAEIKGENEEDNRVEATKAIESFRSYLQSNPPNMEKQADAYMRIGDANYIMKKNEDAAKNYKAVINLKSGYEDQALYFLSRTYLFMGKRNDQISKLLELIKTHKQSDYKLRAIFDLAESYKSDNRFDKSKEYYEKIVNEYPSSILVLDAKINIADIDAKQGNYAKAEQEYKAVMTQYGSNQKVCERVAEGMKELYLLMNEPERIETLAQTYPCFKLDPSEQENLYYIPAMQAYSDSTVTENQRYTNAIPKFEKYLSKFPNGRYVNEVKNYLAQSHYNLGNIDVAIPIFRETLEDPDNQFTENAAILVSKYLFNNGQYADAIPYYDRVETATSSPEIKYNARVGLMRSYFLTEKWADASQYADKVLASSSVSQQIKVEAYYSKGMSNYHLNRFNDAKPALEWIIQNTTTERASQARHSLAELYFKKGDYAEADAEVTKLLKMKPAFNFWIAKSLILRTRVYMAQDKLFDAEQTLRSVIDHYSIQDDGVLDEANLLWDELMQLKNQPKNIEPGTNPIIDINGQ